MLSYIEVWKASKDKVYKKIDENWFFISSEKNVPILSHSCIKDHQTEKVNELNSYLGMVIQCNCYELPDIPEHIIFIAKLSK